jgi:hypothetical protein
MTNQSAGKEQKHMLIITFREKINIPIGICQNID